MEELLRSFKIDIAFLPINGNKPERKVAGNLNPQEAAMLAKAIGAKAGYTASLPSVLNFNTEDPKAFEEQCLKHRVIYKVLEMGEGVVYG